MTEIKGDRLQVNLSASEVRRRLKGHGFGVRKVHSAGKNRALIIHTATGEHRRELEALFAGTVAAATEQDEGSVPAGDLLERLSNLGPTSAAWLHEIGVHSRSDLEQLGPVVAYRLVKQRQPGCSLNLLWALAGALMDRDWRELPAEMKQQLRREAEEE